MKKLLALTMSTLMSAMLFAGCGSDKNEQTPGESKPATEGALKTGLAVITSASSSKDSAEGKDGTGQVDSTIIAVTVDKDGKIVDCIIDGAQTRINFDAKGKLTSDLAAEIKTKNELGDSYGMKKASGIGKEWYEQAAALASYVKGKTVEEVKSIKVSEDGKPAESDLSASVTISISGYVNGIEKAVKNAKELGANAGDKLGLGAITTISNSKDASAEDGIAQAATDYAVVTVDKNGKITSAIIDASQTDVKFSAEGKITSDPKAEYKTKAEIGDDYGMKKASGIGKEWYEQVNSFADYMKGKTLAEIKGITLSEGKPSASDIKSSVTISVGGYIAVIEKAVDSIK